jgi:hypothetical protein
MDLEQLKLEWRTREARLEEAIRIDRGRIRAAWIEGARRDLEGFRLHAAFEVGSGILVALLLGSFLAAHAGEWRFAVPAALLLAWVVAMGVAGIANRARLRSVDYSQPVVAIQRRLAELRTQRLLVLRWGFLTGQVLWFVPLFIVLFRAAGVDLYALSPHVPGVMAWAVGGGIAFIPVALWIGTHQAPGIEATRIGQRLLDMLAGPDLEAARGFLARLEDFEREGATT